MLSVFNPDHVDDPGLAVDEAADPLAMAQSKADVDEEDPLTEILDANPETIPDLESRRYSVNVSALRFIYDRLRERNNRLYDTHSAPQFPSDLPPGSEAKIILLTERIASKRQAFHPLERPLADLNQEDVELIVRRLRNGAIEIQGLQRRAA